MSYAQPFPVLMIRCCSKDSTLSISANSVRRLLLALRQLFKASHRQDRAYVRWARSPLEDHLQTSRGRLRAQGCEAKTGDKTALAPSYIGDFGKTFTQSSSTKSVGTQEGIQ